MELKKQTNPVKAIRAKCLDCMCGQIQEVALCPCEDCALYPFRFGKNPYRAERKMTEEEKVKLVERLGRGKSSPMVLGEELRESENE